MRLRAVTTFPVWADTTPMQAWALCRTGAGRDDHPDVIGWGIALTIDIAGDQREFLVVNNTAAVA